MGNRRARIVRTATAEEEREREEGEREGGKNENVKCRATTVHIISSRI